MIVNDCMNEHIRVIGPETTINQALKIREEQGTDPLIVSNKRKELIGMITEKDLLSASPSIATSLSRWELHYLLDKISVKHIIPDRLITASADTMLEEAVNRMLNNNLCGLPVIDKNNHPIGIITIQGILRMFIEKIAFSPDPSPPVPVPKRIA